MTRVQASAQPLLRVTVALLVVACFAALALDWDDPSSQETLEQPVEPISSVVPRCAAEGADALAYARTLEQMASARWERLPFSLEEAPRAALQMAEAEACYAAAHDRAGRVRAGGLRAAYVAEVQQRFIRARLLLRVAMREQRSERARQQVAVLSALLTLAPESARAYRAELEQLARSYAAFAQESALSEESTP